MKTVLLLIIAITITMTNLYSQNYKMVNVIQASEIIKENKNSEDFHIIDARRESEYLEGHIPNAIHIDPLISESLDKLSKLDTSGNYLIYCRTRNRIIVLFNIMYRIGFENIILMTDGWLAWKAAGYEVEIKVTGDPQTP